MTWFVSQIKYYFSGTGPVARRGRLPTEPGPDTMGYASPILNSPIKSPPYNHAGTDSDDNSYKCEYTQSNN